MKSNFLILVAILCGFSGCTQHDDMSAPKGPYLGMEPPGLTPEVFAPGIISGDEIEAGSGFVLEGNLVVFHRYFPEVPISTIFVTEARDSGWTEPFPAPFNSEQDDWDFTVAPDGRTVFFTSTRPVCRGGKPSPHGNIWKTRLTATGWLEPRILESPVNTTEGGNQYPSVTLDGTLYFFSGRDGGFGSADIYRAERTDGKYVKVENLGNIINTEYMEGDPFIAPDESILIFASKRPGGFGGPLDLYISFRGEDGSWTPPVNMGSRINTNGEEFCPNLTPDGKYFFFCRHTKNVAGRMIGDLYWVDAKIIEGLQPDAWN